jgi:DNA polymerase-3 subunit gamma/tau
MPYEVTAARKRPQSFEQLAGQEFVAATLEKSLETGRIAHAYLFSGPRGCGKTSTARILAKALNCEKGPTAEPCGVCDACKAITAGSSLDVIEIDGASNTSVENVRQIKDEVLFPPNSSRYKIYIIDEVHMLSTSAFNALLKTIEEPPPYVIFMFATTEQHKVPATIKSRCQQFTFRLVSPDVIVGLLEAAAADLGVAAEPEALLWIARESGGSVRDAYTLLDQVVSFSEGHITAALIREKLGLVGQDRMNALFKHFTGGDTAGALAALDDILSGGVSPEQFVADTVEYCRGLLLLKHGITRESLLGAPLSSFDLGIAEVLSGERIEQALAIFLGAYRALKDSIDPRYELDLAVAKASHLQSYVSPSEVVRAVGAIKRFLERGAAPAAAATAAASPGAGRVEQSVRQAVRTPMREPERAPERVYERAPERTPQRDPEPARYDAAPRPAAERAAAAAPAPAGAATAAASQAEPQAARQAATPNGPAFTAPSLPELKKLLVADIRKNNVLLAATLDKSHSWELVGDELSVTVSTAMERDLLKRFLGIIAEMLSLRMGAPSKLEVVLRASAGASAGANAGAGHGPGAASGIMAGGAFGPGDDPFNAGGPSGAAADPSPAAAPGASQGSERDAPLATRQVPSAFNEKPQDRARSVNGTTAPRTAAASPNVTPAEREAIKLVERLFKGTLAGFAAAGAAPASATIGSNLGAKTSPGGRPNSVDADDRAAVYEPERYDGETFEA